ncbi:MAG: chemotaxis protein CheA [Candidatus Marinimicrobia bacterium]|nr:chemotaxis protein CheA [Candidatus Neomarinimicrobiota bacterium]
MIEYENREVVNEFLEETLSGFDIVVNALLELEKEPGSVDIINTIFRPIHSLKGNSAYFGLMKVKKLTHHVENLLDNARKGKLQITEDIINLLLASMDYLREMIQRVEQDEDEVDDEDKYIRFIKEIERIIVDEEQPYAISESEKNKLLVFLKSMSETESEFNQTARDLMNIFIKENPGKSSINAELTEIEPLLELLTKPFQEYEADTEESNAIKEKMDSLMMYCTNENTQGIYNELMETFEAFLGIGLDEVGQEILKDKVLELKKIIGNGKKGPERAADSKSDVTEPKLEKTKLPSSELSTIRINENSLDEFLNYVAELLSVEELFGYMSRDLANYDLTLSSNFKRNLEDFSRISTNLRNGIMEVRKVKAANLLQKGQRIVRDIAKNSDKKINVVIEGEDLKIDKSYVELLDSPLVHMVRNAADHGIEPTDERIKAGKNAEGTINIRLCEDDKNLVLEIIDDGAGLDLERIRLKAIEKGIISEKQPLEEKDIIELLFKSGVSTAKEITDVSGRGVGMDVVKTAIESANGKISVKSVKTKGAVFSVILPRNVSTQINDVYLVKSFSDEIYALPLKMIEEAFTIDFNDIFSIKDKGNVVSRRGKLLSVFVLDEILEIKKNMPLKNYYHSQGRVPFVYVNYPENPIALCIKEVVGVQTIVIKGIENVEVKGNLFDGAATLGDGKIALKINMDWMMENVCKR